MVAWVEEMGGEVFPHWNHGLAWQKTKDKWFGEHVSIVHLEAAPVSDISPLTQLKNLEKLSLIGTPVSDLSPLTELKKLETLFLNGTHVSDLSPLAELKNLKWLYLMDTPVSNLSVLYLSAVRKPEEKANRFDAINFLPLPNCSAAAVSDRNLEAGLAK